MKGLVICNKGIEDVSALEVKELINSESKIHSGCVEFEIKKLEDLCLLSYRMQSISKVLLLLDKFKIKSLEDIKESINDIELPDFFSKCFVVRSLKLDNSMSSQEIEKETGKFILRKKDIKVDLKNPNVIFFVFINGEDCYLGIDFSGADISKRDYRIFTYAGSLKATIAYALFRISDFKGGILLDPLCGEGSILIEAGLYLSKLSPCFYNKDKFAFLKFMDYDFEDKQKKIKQKLFGFDNQLRHIKSCEKNSKIAGVDFIEFVKNDVEWLDDKFDDNYVNVIVSHIPSISKDKYLSKLHKELFYQANHILKEKGRLVLICNHLEELKEAGSLEGFEISSEKEVWQGQEKFMIGMFKRKNVEKL